MDLSTHITSMPRPYDPERGHDASALVPGLDAPLKELVAGAAGCSPYLSGLLSKEKDWLESAVHDVDAALEAELRACSQWAPDALADGLRQGKRRVALLTALADLGGAWPLTRVTGVLTDFADHACQAALRAAVLAQIKRQKLPGLSEADADDAGGMAILAMGKMGAGELNYSSDIDLICLFDETRFDQGDYHEARAAFARATRAMMATLSEITAQGYVFRTDLRLRPDPSVTPVCIAMEAAERYYESLGRTWERAAFIKARVAAGDKAAGARFLATLTPFVWRRHLDFAAIQDAHDMRLAIREHKGLGGPITLPGHDMKLGRGGIREIEFFTQTRQLIAGGRDPDLRCRGTVPGLRVLAQKAWISGEVSDALEDHYTAHRTVEHRLQMVRDAQTHCLPKSDGGFARIAAMMDMDAAALQEDLRRRLSEVHELTEGFFAPTEAVLEPPLTPLDEKITERWVSYPALRSARSRQIFERVKPGLLARLGRAARPHDALTAFDGFLSGLPAGVQLFSLLDANPQLTDLIIDITGTSPALAQYLSRNAGVFDAVIGGDFFTPWPGQDGMQGLLRPVLDAETDYERQLDAARRFFKEWHFRVGVHLLRGLISPRAARAQYSDLARVVLCEVWTLVVGEFSTKFGPPPGRGAVIVGMGSLGAATLAAGSDLDLIVVYDAADQDFSTGQKQIPSRLYYAKLTQALITALSAPMAQGKLFEVDMRLRPSGNQGPVATSLSAFQSYQREQAWVWEHLALTRARVVAGPADLAQDVTSFIEDLLCTPRDLSHVATEVAAMRVRLQAAKAPASLWDIKTGKGRLQDVDLMAQAGALLSGRPFTSTEDGLAGAGMAGLLEPDAVDEMGRAAAFYLDLHTAARLLSPKPLERDRLGIAAQEFLLHGHDGLTINALETLLAQRYTTCDAMLSTALAPYSPESEAT